MKRYLAILFVIGFSYIFSPVNANAQIWGKLGAEALKEVGGAVATGIGRSMIKKSTAKVEQQSEKLMDKAMDKMLGLEAGSDTIDRTEALVTKASALGSAVNAFSNSVVGDGLPMGGTPKAVTLRDFSAQNAERREFNKTLTYDDWD